MLLFLFYHTQHAELFRLLFLNQSFLALSIMLHFLRSVRWEFPARPMACANSFRLVSEISTTSNTTREKTGSLGLSLVFTHIRPESFPRPLLLNSRLSVGLCKDLGFLCFANNIIRFSVKCLLNSQSHIVLFPSFKRCFGF